MTANETTTRPAVLVVEDEPLQRMMAVDLVEQAGFAALAAANADQALGILEKRGDISVVFTDINLPHGMDGMRLAKLIRDRWPPVGVIITSGHIDSRQVALPSRSRFFPKPYREREIVEALRALSP
jgi:CheY-like chemotaxis protein